MRKAFAALTRSAVPGSIRFPAWPARGFGPNPTRPVPAWLEWLPSLLLMVLLSPVWYETDAYRIALLLIAVLALVHYFTVDFWYESRPRIGAMGLACIAWGAYVAWRIAAFAMSHPGEPLGSNEGIYLLTAAYGTLGYAMWRYMNRPLVLATTFMIVSLAALIWGFDFGLLEAGHRASTRLHNNTIHAAIAAGFILLAAIAYGAHAVAVAERDRSWPASAMVALAGATAIVAALTVIALTSKGVWLSLGVALPLLLIAIARHGVRHGKNRAGLALFTSAAAVLTASTAFAFKDRLVSISLKSTESAISLGEAVLGSGSIAQSMRDIAGNPETPRTVVDRLTLWVNGLEIWQNHPIAGAGLAWLGEWQNRPDGTTMPFDFFHNGFLEIAVRYGFVGLVFYGVLFAWSARQAHRASLEGLLPRTAWHLHVSAMVYFALTLLTNSNVRLAIGEAYMLFAAGFGFYCFALRQDAGTVHSRSWI